MGERQLGKNHRAARIARPLRPSPVLTSNSAPVIRGQVASQACLRLLASLSEALFPVTIFLRRLAIDGEDHPSRRRRIMVGRMPYFCEPR